MDSKILLYFTKHFLLKTAFCLSTISGLGYYLHCRLRQNSKSIQEDLDAPKLKVKLVGLNNLGNTCYMNSLV